MDLVWKLLGNFAVEIHQMKMDRTDRMRNTTFFCYFFSSILCFMGREKAGDEPLSIKRNHGDKEVDLTF